MRLALVAAVLGSFLVSLGLLMLLPAIFAFAYGEGELWGLLAAAGATGAAGLGLKAAARAERREIHAREALLIVAGVWLAASLFGSLPFLLCGTLESFTDCVFESTSGFTTTGATVLGKIEGVSRGILFWRALTHWLGGMGIIVLSVAILPLIGVGGMSLYRAEVPGHGTDKIKPRIAETARTLWLLYAGLTGAEAVLLMLGGLDLHAALCHSFATMATGGFSTRDLSIEAYGSPYLEWVITLFMLMAGVNFALHFAALKGGPGRYWRNTEFRVYAVIFLAAALIGTIVLRLATVGATGLALRQAAFQAASILTTTGFTTTDYELWPGGLQLLLLTLMFIGGCTGSTGGGIKVLRIWLMARAAMNELFLLVHPRAVRPLTYGGSPVAPETTRSLWGFFFLFMGLFFGCSLLLALISAGSRGGEMDPLSCLAAVAACLGNIGPGLGSVGPHDNYAHVATAGKWLLSLCMLLGRLEVYTIIILFVPEFWKK